MRLHCASVNQDANLTGLLQQWSRGDSDALNALAPLVQHELRAIARRLLKDEARRRLESGELVQESFLRLLTWRSVQWKNRAHFFAAAAQMMRRVLVDLARTRRAQKRGAGIDPLFYEEGMADAPPSVDLVALNDALDALAQLDPRPSQVVEMRFFGGFTVEETAEALGISVRMVNYDWNTARAWLRHELTGKDRS
jgi:RNA polymerase sigma factor (TIGR02999 family)